MIDEVIARGIEEISRNFNVRDCVEDKRIIVTGGAGFIGSWLCDVLVENGAELVLCVDNLASGLRENISHLLERENFSFIKHDIVKPLEVEGRVDAILHLASRASPLEFEKFPIQIVKANTIGTWIALGIAKRKRARLLFTSTSEVYGDAEVIPTPETYNGNVSCVGVRSCYDEAKRCGEALCKAYERQHNLDVRIARIFNTYGPRMRAEGVYGRVIPRFIHQVLSGKPITIFGDGHQTRSFCYIADQIEGLLRLLCVEDARGAVVNIGSPQEIEILKLAAVIQRVAARKVPLEFLPALPDDPRRRCPDITRARTLLGFEPKVSLEEGLRLTFEWFKEKLSKR